MPDIRTALQQALSKTATAWAADDEAHQQIQPQQGKHMTTTTTHADTIAATETKTNVSRCVFEFVRDNPGYTVKQVVAALVARGFKENSVGSLVYQMMKVRLVVADANGKLTAVVQEYAPIQASSQRRRKVKVKVNAKAAAAEAYERKYVEIVNTRTGEVINPRPVGIAALPNTSATGWTVESVIGGLNVRQAMAVYDELRQIFGG